MIYHTSLIQSFSECECKYDMYGWFILWLDQLNLSTWRKSYYYAQTNLLYHNMKKNIQTTSPPYVLYIHNFARKCDSFEIRDLLVSGKCFLLRESIVLLCERQTYVLLWWNSFVIAISCFQLGLRCRHIYHMSGSLAFLETIISA